MKLAITIGLPYAGKSLFCKWLNEKGPLHYTIICPDTIRTALYGGGEPQILETAEPYIWAIAQTMVRHFLLQGCNVIVDAVNLTKEARKTWVNIANEFKIPMDMYWINTGYTICKRENEERGYLPKKVFEAMVNSLEYPDYREIRHGDIYIVNRTQKDKEGGTFGKLVKKDKA